MTRYCLAVILALGLVLSGCTTFQRILGYNPPGEPTVNLRSAETRWLLIKNPRFGDVASEPEYVWVEEEKVPTTMKTLLLGKRSIIASPEIVAKYGPPPGGGKISPRQGVPYQTVEPPKAEKGGHAIVAATLPAGPAGGATTAAAPESKRGFVVFVDTNRIVIDLTAADGVKPGAIVSLRRDKIPIVHPVTGEVLGELDEEVATARITETRDKFSVAEVQNVAPGMKIEVKDRAVLK